jgi:iron complex outermembrane receptor protein
MRVISARVALFGTVAAAALFTTPAFAAQANVSTSPAAPNNAQTQTQAATGSDQEIVVTARRRDERLLNVPIAVTAYSGEQLDRQGALDITDLAETTPNVTLEASRGTNSTLTAFIRGIGQQDPVAGFEQGVGIYLDDVYLNRPQAAVLDIYDVERIEVLRGPQGTLYGRNTVGGAVKYVTRRIPADGPHLDMRVNLGTYRQADFIVTASTPVTSSLLLGVAAARLSNRGFGKNFTTGLSNYNKDVFATRGTIEFVPSTDSFFRVSGDYTVDDSNARGGHRLIPSQLTHTPMLSNVYDTQGGLNTPRQKVMGGGLAAHGELGLTDTIKLRSITAWRKDKTGSPIDFDALPAQDVDVAGIYRNRQFSQELQLVYQSHRLNGVAGAYYLNADGLTAFDVRIFTTFPGLAAFTNADIKTKTEAVFADFSYDFTDQLSLSLGGRYTWDKRHGIIFRQNYLGGGATLFGGLGIPFGAPSTNFNGSRKFNKFTPRASLTYKPNRDNTLYISYSQGFKGGGFDPRGVGTNAPDLNGNGTLEQSEVGQFIGFKPETVDSYEAGYKASLFDHRLSLATAIFHANYKDVQIPGSAACTVNGIASFCGITANAGKARFQGAELEANATVARDLAGAGDRLNLAGSLGYIDAKYLSYQTFIAGRGTVEVSQFRHVQNTPKWTMSGTLDYTTPAGAGTLNLNSTLSYKSKTYQFEIANPYFDQNAYALLDGNIVWRSTSGRYEFGLHAKNLLNKHYKTSGYTFMAADPVTGTLLTSPTGNLIPALGKEGVLTAFYGNPRQVFLSAAVHF